MGLIYHSSPAGEEDFMLGISCGVELLEMVLIKCRNPEEGMVSGSSKMHSFLNFQWSQ